MAIVDLSLSSPCYKILRVAYRPDERGNGPLAGSWMMKGRTCNSPLPSIRQNSQFRLKLWSPPQSSHQLLYRPVIPYKMLHQRPNTSRNVSLYRCILVPWAPPFNTKHIYTTRELQSLDKINDNIFIFTQNSCTPLLCLGVVVRINAVFDMHAFIVRFFIFGQEGRGKAFSEFLTENLRLSLSQSSLGSIPRSWAAFWIFIPCSSVPVVNTTLRFGAERRAWRANVSAIDKE